MKIYSEAIIRVHDYDRRINRYLENLKKLKNKNNLKKILEYIDYLINNSYSKATQLKYLERLYKFSLWTDKDFKKITKKDMENIIKKNLDLNTSNSNRITNKVTDLMIVKKFWQWLKNCEDDEYPDEVKWIKFRFKNNNKHNHY